MRILLQQVGFRSANYGNTTFLQSTYQTVKAGLQSTYQTVE